jgi:hypothetical protein
MLVGRMGSVLREAPAARAGAQRGSLPASLLADQRGYLVFDSKLLAFKVGDDHIVGVGPVLFFFKLVFEFCVLCSQRFNMLCHGHARVSDL